MAARSRRSLICSSADSTSLAWRPGYMTKITFGSSVAFILSFLLSAPCARRDEEHSGSSSHLEVDLGVRLGGAVAVDEAVADAAELDLLHAAHLASTDR